METFYVTVTSFGPIVTLIALGYAFILLWRGAREEKQGLSLVGLWVLIASYMAWTAGRFILNATPAMAVVGAIGIAALWIWRKSCQCKKLACFAA